MDILLSKWWGGVFLQKLRISKPGALAVFCFFNCAKNCISEISGARFEQQLFSMFNNAITTSKHQLRSCVMSVHLSPLRRQSKASFKKLTQKANRKKNMAIFYSFFLFPPFPFYLYILFSVPLALNPVIFSILYLFPCALPTLLLTSLPSILLTSVLILPSCATVSELNNKKALISAIIR